MILHHARAPVDDDTDENSNNVPRIHQSRLQLKHRLERRKRHVRGTHDEQRKHAKASVRDTSRFRHRAQPLFSRFTDVSIGLLCSTTVRWRPTSTKQPINQPQRKTAVQHHQTQRYANKSGPTIAPPNPLPGGQQQRDAVCGGKHPPSGSAGQEESGR